MAEQKFLDGEGLKLVKKDYDTKIGKKVDSVEGSQLVETTDVEKLKGLANIKKVQIGDKEQTVGEDGTLTLDVQAVIDGDHLATDEEVASKLQDYTKTSDLADDPGIAGKYLDKETAGTTYVKEEGFDEKVKASVGSVYRPKGSKENFEAIKAVETPTEGDVYNATDSGANYVYVGEGQGDDESGWDKLSETIDLSSYETTASVTEKLAQKADSTTVTEGLASKADKTELPQALSTEEINQILQGEE